MKYFFVTILSLSLLITFDTAAAPKKRAAKAKAKTVQSATPKTTPSASPTPAASPAATTGFQRLDPHGKPDAKLKEIKLADHPECRVCHTSDASAGKKIGTKPDAGTICFACHGRLPHSGVMEHMGDEPGGGAGLDCLGCHRPHRATSDGSPQVPRTHSFLWRPHANLPTAPSMNDGSEGLIEQPYTKDGKGHTAGDAMIDHPCTECHSF